MPSGCKPDDRRKKKPKKNNRRSRLQAVKEKRFSYGGEMESMTSKAPMPVVKASGKVPHGTVTLDLSSGLTSQHHHSSHGEGVRLKGAKTGEASSPVNDPIRDLIKWYQKFYYSPTWTFEIRNKYAWEIVRMCREKYGIESKVYSASVRFADGVENYVLPDELKKRIEELKHAQYEYETGKLRNRILRMRYEAYWKCYDAVEGEEL